MVNYLRGSQTAEEYITSIVESGEVYNLFNLVLMEPDSSVGSNSERPYKLLFFNYLDKKIIPFGGGIHAFGNSFLSKPFIKVQEGGNQFANIVEKVGIDMDSEKQLISSLFEMAGDTTLYYPDEALQKQGKGYPEEFLKGLSSIHVSIPSADYGSR